MTDQIVQRSAVIHLEGDVDAVFPLFTAIGEYHWIPGWKAEFIYPTSGEPMTNNVFTTQLPGHAPTTWVTVDYDTTAHHVEYANVTPDSHAQRVEIQCQRTTDGGTDAEVTFTVIATSEAGGAEIKKFSEAAYVERMAWWIEAINHYLRHGELIAAH